MITKYDGKREGATELRIKVLKTNKKTIETTKLKSFEKELKIDLI